MLFVTPPPDDDDRRVVAKVEELRRKLRIYLHEPKRWKGQMRRSLKARAVRGSNPYASLRRG